MHRCPSSVDRFTLEMYCSLLLRTLAVRAVACLVQETVHRQGLVIPELRLVVARCERLRVESVVNVCKFVSTRSTCAYNFQLICDLGSVRFGSGLNNYNIAIRSIVPR